MEDGIVVSESVERDFCESALQIKISDSDAALIADTLVESDLRGVYSHGIQIMPRYIRGLSDGINPRPTITKIVDAGALVTLDGGGGMGQIVSFEGMNIAIERARVHGIGSVTVRNSNHMGALSYYGAMAAKEGMIGMCFSNAPAIMAPWGGITETLGNNPACFSVPAGKSYPIILDMAVSTAARNKVRVAAAKGEKLPAGWALDKEGQPTTDPDVALAGLLAPMAQAKGFGLAVVIESLTSILGGGLIGKDVPRDTLFSIDVFKPVHVSHYFQAIDVSKLMDLDEFKSRVDELSDQVHETEMASNTDAVYMPGEIEFLTKEDRKKNGIPISSAVLSTLDRIADEIGISKLPR